MSTSDAVGLYVGIGVMSSVVHGIIGYGPRACLAAGFFWPMALLLALWRGTRDLIRGDLL